MIKHVKGKNNKKKVFLYALSTCIWCAKTKGLLNSYDVDYDYEDVDLLTGEAEKKAIDEVKKWYGKELYPTIIINGKHAIQGYKEAEVKKEFGT
jgi:glutaredoxin-like protein NrdH